MKCVVIFVLYIWMLHCISQHYGRINNDMRIFFFELRTEECTNYNKITTQSAQEHIIFEICNFKGILNYVTCVTKAKA